MTKAIYEKAKAICEEIDKLRQKVEGIQYAIDNESQWNKCARIEFEICGIANRHYIDQDAVKALLTHYQKRLQAKQAEFDALGSDR